MYFRLGSPRLKICSHLALDNNCLLNYANEFYQRQLSVKMPTIFRVYSGGGHRRRLAKL